MENSKLNLNHIILFLTVLLNLYVLAPMATGDSQMTIFMPMRFKKKWVTDIPFFSFSHWPIISTQRGCQKVQWPWGYMNEDKNQQENVSTDV